MCLILCDQMDCSPPGSSLHGDSPGKNTGVGCHALLQGIVPTQESNWGLLHCRWILYQLSYQGSPSQHLPNIKWPSIIRQPQGKACGCNEEWKEQKASSFHPNQEVTCETTKDILGYVMGKSGVLLQEHVMDFVSRSAEEEGEGSLQGRLWRLMRTMVGGEVGQCGGGEGL